MDNPSSSSIFLEDFGQKVDLTRRIREVLLNYPEGTTVLKELIQNADDAGATKVCLCLDRRRHGADSLLSNTLAQWQGPSLLAYNDAVFTEDDFVSISRIGGSTKHAQAWKTGRFGVGFNSVYHLTDLPSFVSGKYVVLFDPQGVYLPNVSAANPGKRIEYVTTSAISLYEDQFFPFCAFGCDMKTPFNGTLFRFPLRNADQASQSKLSRQAYSEDDVSSMFTQLYEEGVFSLLFLKSVLSVDMYVWDVGETAPSKLYSGSVNSSGKDVISHRQLLLRLSKLPNHPTFEMDSFMLDFVSETFTGSSIQKKTDTFYIVQGMASSSSRIGAFAAKASKEYDIHLLPWASIAACISDDSSNDDACKSGRAFCFLPLPVTTGLMVQVNGYFEVSSNRRGIWYGADMDRSGKVRSIWNRLLLEDIIAPAFKTLLLDLQGRLGPTKLYYSLWPTGDFEEPWSILVQHIYKNLVQAPVLYSFVQGGKWVSPAESFLHDEEFTCKVELANVLLHLGMPVVRVPISLHHMLLKYTSEFQQKVVTPDTVRCFLREFSAVDDLGRSERLLLLEYCLDDLLDSDIGKHASNLPLLPLACGAFGSFSEALTGISFFICKKLEHKLLQQISDRVLDANLPEKIISRLLSIADSSGANLVAFKIEHLVQLFDKFMPPEWRFKSKVLWEHGSNQNNHPTSMWFVTFWEYLSDQCENLSVFNEWPILPSTSGHLYRLSLEAKMIKADKLPENLKCLLDKIGCKVLDSKYGIEHPNLSQYVSNATGPAVLESIFNNFFASGGIGNTCLQVLKAEEKDELRNFLLNPMWYVGSYMGVSDISKCKMLPIFRVHGVGCDDQLCFSDLVGSEKYLPPVDVLNCFLGDEFISTSSDVEETVLHTYYGLKRMGKAQFYRKQVFSRIKDLPAEDRDQVMLSVLRDLPHLCIEDPLFKDSVRNLAFMPTHSGASRCPDALYDPRNEELHALLEDTDLFPCGVFKESDILDVLQGLGLRTSASPETVIQSACYVEQIRQEDPEKAYFRGKVLLSYVEANAHRWAAIPLNDDHGTLNRMFSRAATAFRPRNMKSDLEKFWNDLRLICWCPVVVSAPFQALPWPVVSSTVAPPKLVRPGIDLWLVSASMRILDGECSSTVLSRQLGWSSPPSGTVVAAQILELGKNNEVVTDQVFRQQLALAMPRIYVRLTEIISTDEMDIVKAVLEGCRWIWVGDGFATAEEVVLNGPLHMAPYIRVIPVDLAVFKELFLELGVREFLTFTDYAKILCRMATRKGDDSLTTEELSAAILIVQHLAAASLHEKDVLVYLPDTSGRLRPVSDLVYNDAPWLLGLEDSDISSNPVLCARQSVQRFVHGNISNDVAEKLGVCSQRRSLLAQSADSMNLSLSGAAEAFGQHEALTTRLKHILEMYADGPGILFELVQNAEDAGASEVNFLLDKTHHGTSSLLSPEMADWQGPALYCYNDSVFSPQDLYSISRIGQDSKLEKPFAIGRFGLGFNCVYHFTDIPSFVSGENIVMFDPHACNLPGISPSHPGLRIKFAGRRILEQFPDQFSPFLYFGCDLQNHFPGTLFRFPLRTAGVAPRSQIKQEGYAPDDVLSLFSSFSQVVSETLLFLRRVKSISLYVKDGTNTEMQLVHRVQRHTVPELEPPQRSLQQMFDFFNGDQRKPVDRNHFLDKLSRFSEDNLPRRCQKVVMTENSSSYNVSHVWMMSECLGSGKVHNDSTFIKSKSHKCLPWAAVAAYLNSTEIDSIPSDLSLAEKSLGPLQGVGLSVHSRENFDGRAFCFLPLPISTGLPVHVNGYFELSSNRRDIWFGNDMSGGGRKRSEWNIYLLEHVSAPAYAYLLERLAVEVGPFDLFLSFWPLRLGGDPWSSVVQKLYTYIADYNIRVLYTKARGGQWISAKQALFPDFSFDKMLELVDVLSDVSLPLINVPQTLVERFVEVRSSLHFLTPHLLRMLLIRRKCKFTDKHALLLTLRYCLHDLAKPVQFNCLHGLPLIPLASGSSAAFSPMGVEERIYIARQNEYELLKEKIPTLLVDKAIPEEVYMKLCDIAESDDSNVSFLTSELLEKLFLRILPIDWHNAKQVKWIPGHLGQPSVDWMKLLWSYLGSSCEDLDVFSKWPILPVGNGHLMQLTRNSNIIEDEGWSENMSSLLLKVGCLFLRSDLSVEHPQLKIFVRSASAAGLLSAFLAIADKIENVDGLFVDASEGEMHELRNFILQSKWFSDDEMHDIHIEIIKHVPMFESYRSRNLVNLNAGIKWLKPNGLREDLLNDDFVRAESEKERSILSRHVNIQEISKAEFYKCYVLNNMSDFLHSQGAVSSILLDVKLLVEEDISVKNSLSVTPFVLARNGSWQQPSRLYDPRVQELHVLLHPEVFFPAEEFSEPETLDMLVGLGLKQSLGYPGLLDCARTVSLLNDSMDPKTLDHGRRLLFCLDALGSKLLVPEEHNSPKELGDPLMSQDDWNIDALGSLPDEKPEEDFWSELKSIKWCPIYTDPPLKGLPWLKSSDLVAAPSKVRPKTDMWMVSYTMQVLNADFNSEFVKNKLGWMDRPCVQVLSSQLVELSKSYDHLKLDSTFCSDFDAELQKGIASVYAMMQEYIGTQDFITLKSALEGVPWVWIGDGFVAPDALAFDSPLKYQPYLYVVPSELSSYRELLLALGVKLSFEVSDYYRVLQKLNNEIKKSALSDDQLSFVLCVLEAVADCYSDKLPEEGSNAPLLIPDASGILMHAKDLVFNDAPWMENNILIGKYFVHPRIGVDLASMLGVQSLRCMSLVDEEMAKDLVCMDSARISELLSGYGSAKFLLFDLLELADSCNTTKMHVIFDKREHPCQSLLQHNLGEFQGPALLVIFEGASLSREEITALQFLPPWRLRGHTLNYGLALLSTFSVCDLLSVMSAGYYYMFDPHGVVLAPPSSHSPTAKVFSLTGTNLTERFSDQFSPMHLDQLKISSTDVTIIRIPLSSEFMERESGVGAQKIKQIYDKFMDQGSRALLFLKSVFQVSLSTWEEGSVQPSEDYSVCVDSSCAALRNPFAEKKWRKFQISRLFSSSNAATKMHAIDVSFCQGDTKVAEQWVVVLSLGSGQTRNMALDRRYLAYNLTPVAGIAARVSRNGFPADASKSGCIMAPLPLSAKLDIPVTILGHFLVRHNKGRYLFKYQGFGPQPDAGNQLIEEWNRELMTCIRDSYLELTMEMHKLRRGLPGSADEPSASHAVKFALMTFGDHLYSLWPRSFEPSHGDQPDVARAVSVEFPKADWNCIIDRVIKPFYVRLADLPVWPLYSGNLVRVEEGMFLSQPGNGVGDTLLPATVCNFVKEHYPVFSVPWDLINELQAVGVTVREIKPKMVRDLLRVSSTSVVVRSVETYVDVLEYCLSDIQLNQTSSSNVADTGFDSLPRGSRLPDGNSTSLSSIRGLHGVSTHSSSNSGVDALEMVSSLGKALIDFSRGVVEEIGSTGGPMAQRSRTMNNNSFNISHGENKLAVVAELKRLPCPTATNQLARLGITELWVGNSEQQTLMEPLSGKFVHLKILERPILADIFTNSSVQSSLKLLKVSLHLLANHMRLLFHENWVNHVTSSNLAPWFSWETGTGSGGEGGPSPDWIRLFWNNFDGSTDDLSLFSDWPLIPARLGRPVLCRVRERHLVFVPPPVTNASHNNAPDVESSEHTLSGFPSDLSSVSEAVLPYHRAFIDVQNTYPWLFSLLNQCNIPIYDPSFLDCACPCDCLPAAGLSLGQVIASKLVKAKQAGYFPELTSVLASDCEELFNLFVFDMASNRSSYGVEELEVLRALPIYKTVIGSYTRLNGQDVCVIASNSFLKPYDERVLSYTMDSDASLLLRALGVSELHDKEILTRFGLTGFQNKGQSEQEDILIYIYMNWQELQIETSVVDALKETHFIRNADEFSLELSKAGDLFDPSDALLTSVFSGERKRFPGERFAADGWLRILRKLGLRSATEADIMLECARRVEYLGTECIKQTTDFGEFVGLDNSQSELSLEIWSLATSVVETVFSNFAVLYSNNFCNAFGKIACIPSEKGFPNVDGKRGGRRVLSSYSDAILLKDWPLAWSCAPILSRQNVIPPEYSWGALHLRSPPPFSTVLKHLQTVGKDGGGDSLAHWSTSANMMTVEDAACEVLKYLDKVWTSLSSSDIQELEKVAFLPAANGTRLVKASSLFVHLGVNLSPFAFELPSMYLPFVKILKELGLRDSLSIGSAKDTLLNLQKACGYQRLNPNELRAVMEILHFICDETDESKLERSGWDLDAVVPDDGSRLVHARSCVYIDSYGSRFAKFIDSSRLRFIHPSVPEKTSLTLGIKKLSEVVVEELNVEAETLEYIGSVSLTFIRQKLVMRSFQDAVFKILASVGSNFLSFQNLSSEEVRCLLEDAADKLQFVRSIYTRFLLFPNNIDITSSASKGPSILEGSAGSGHRALYYINKGKTLLLVAEPPSYISVLDMISIVLSDILGSPTPLPISSLFLCPENTEGVVTDILRICSEDKRGQNMVNGGSDLLGKDIMPQDASQVQIHPLRPFYMGEIVAWRSQNGEKLKYGRVPENVRPSSGQALYRLGVETASGRIQSLLSTHVFSFKSVSLDSEHTSEMSPDTSHTASETTLHTQNYGGTKRGNSTSTQTGKDKDLQYGRVGPAELVQAVHEMLSAAGVSVDMEAQTLLRTNLTLQEQLHDSQAALLLQQEKAESAAREAETAKGAWQCRICLAAEVEVTMIPCGHVLCRRCSSAVTRCPFCRLRVSKTMKIFRP